eukprot:TRINITY_DN14799_c0_g1_i1.p1 TRINITY_DN14799_c0_g1~~TRINITY_DN14799_c0_g1_i1.p1  ORF type:complete len:194 (+),score=13.50 TRINITY_DN14799_c0_g1_i1:253-834(+)
MSAPSGWKHINLGPVSVAQVACGWKHAVCLTCSGDLLGLGRSSYGQLGVAATKPFLKACTVNIFVENQTKDKIVQIGCGWNFTAALTQNGDIWTLGRNQFGQLGHGCFSKNVEKAARVQTLDRINSIACGADHILALNNGGYVYSWGWNEHGTLGTNDLNNRCSPTRIDFRDDNDEVKIRGIGAGGAHSFAYL